VILGVRSRRAGTSEPACGQLRSEPAILMNLSVLPVLDERSSATVNLREIQETLAAAISTHDVRSDRVTRALYATDASVYQIVPLLVAFPATAADVAAIVRICSQSRVPITARGGGTSQAGQSIGAGVILDCSRFFNRILEINPDERWVRVEPGCVLDELNLALKPLGLLFAPDISTANRATIGGMIANNFTPGWSTSSSSKPFVPNPTEKAPATRPSCAWPLNTPPKLTVASPRSSGAWAAITSTRSYPAMNCPMARSISISPGF
jgi:hypothetical protein